MQTSTPRMASQTTPKLFVRLLLYYCCSVEVETVCDEAAQRFHTITHILSDLCVLCIAGCGSNLSLLISSLITIDFLRDDHRKYGFTIFPLQSWPRCNAADSDSKGVPVKGAPKLNVKSTVGVSLFVSVCICMKPKYIHDVYLHLLIQSVKLYTA